MKRGDRSAIDLADNRPLRHCRPALVPTSAECGQRAGNSGSIVCGPACRRHIDALNAAGKDVVAIRCEECGARHDVPRKRLGEFFGYVIYPDDGQQTLWRAGR